jgi:hypothetical protein
MSEIYHKYMRGEVISSMELCNDNGLRLYGEIIHNDWRRDESTQQPDFFGEVFFQKVHPVELNPEKEHLLRPPDTREGRRQLQASLEHRPITVIEPSRPAGWGQVATTTKNSGGWSR